MSKRDGRWEAGDREPPCGPLGLSSRPVLEFVDRMDLSAKELSCVLATELRVLSEVRGGRLLATRGF